MQLSASPIVLPCEGGPVLCLIDDESLTDAFFASFPLDLLLKGVPISLPRPACSAMPLPSRLLAYITTYPGEHGYLEECFCRAIFHQLKFKKKNFF